MISFTAAKISRLYAFFVFALVIILPTNSATAQGSASLYVTPASGSYQHGAAFSVVVYANTAGETVNAVEISMTYTDSLLTFNGFSSAGSSFEIEAPGASGGSGSISMVRASVSGKSGSAVNVVTLNFTAKSTNGTATLAFTGGSSLLRLSDSANVLGSTTGGSYTIFTNTGGTPPPPPPAPSPTPAPSPSPSPSPSPAGTPSPNPSTSPSAPSPGASPTDSEPVPASGDQPDANSQPPVTADDESVSSQDEESSGSAAPSLKGSIKPATLIGIVGVVGFVVVALGYGLKRVIAAKSVGKGLMSNTITSAGMSSVPLTKSGSVSQTKKQVDDLLSEIPDPRMSVPAESAKDNLPAGTVLQPKQQPPMAQNNKNS